MIQVGIALKSRAEVEVAHELRGYGGLIKVVDYSPYPRFVYRADEKQALVSVLREKVVPYDRSVAKKAAANGFLARFGCRPVWRSAPPEPAAPYASQKISVLLPTVSAFEVGERVREKAPHAAIVRTEMQWQLHFPVDVVMIVVDAIQEFINEADTPTSMQTCEDLLTAIELQLVRLEV
ncbi:MAG: hypothetical protein KDD65_03775 [Bacteroidetes bacterium]|nr:hypothetical protein [Bacteroidota bacterium]